MENIIQLQQMDYNKIQEKLWKTAEGYYINGGLRGTTLSGRICESLLTKSLSKCIKDLKFNTGQIILKDTSKVKNEKEMSPQIDIIVYKGQPYKKYGDVVGVHCENVVAIIEIKRWISENISEKPEEYKQDLDELYEKINKKIEQDKIFLVAFFSRSTPDNVPKERREDLIDTKLKPYNCYILCANKGNGFEPYKDEFEKLVKKIENLVK